MSADNLLIAIPAKGGKISLFDVQLSGLGINLDGPPHQVCAFIARNYPERKFGTYANFDEAEKAAAQYMIDTIVEYGMLDLVNVQKQPRPARP